MRKITPLLLIVVLYFPDSYARQYTQVAFSPSGNAISLVEKSIAAAKYNIYVAAYSFTSEKVSNALIEAHERGVEVKVVLDKTNTNKDYKAVIAIQKAGIPTRINRHYTIMHNKYMIIDEKTIETGSFNYTASAEKRNAENVIVIRNNETLANKYLENWKKLWEESK